jgi:hypothetical protein
METSSLEALVDAHVNELNKDGFIEVGVSVGKLYTDHGFPIDMALAQLKYTKRQKLLVLHGALSWLIEHKRNSGATDKSIVRQRKSNKTTLERFISTGESGVY